MARNKVQFQKGLSEAEFDELYGTKERCHAERNCSRAFGYVESASGAPARVRRIASRAPMERRRAVSMTERMSA